MVVRFVLGCFSSVLISAFLFSAVSCSSLQYDSINRNIEEKNIEESFLRSDNYKTFIQGNSEKNSKDRNKGDATLEKVKALSASLSVNDQSHLLLNLTQLSPEDFEYYIQKIDKNIDININKNITSKNRPNKVIPDKVIPDKVIPDKVIIDEKAALEIALEIARKAYQLNVTKVFKEVAQENKIPIVYRESSEVSQALQQNGLDTKPMRVKNKSSIMESINGLIPYNGLAGKKGDKLRKFEKTPCVKVPEVCKMEKLDLEKGVEAENKMMTQLIQVDSRMGKVQFEKQPVTRVRQDKKEIVIYTDSRASEAKWVVWDNPSSYPENTAWVLAAKGGSLITADTDLVLIGQPKGKPHPVKYDLINGYRTQFSDRIREQINLLWQRYSKNKNSIIQHGDEANFGLNPIDDIYVAFSHDGKVSRFDLTQTNPNRIQEFKKYAEWLKRESLFVDIPIPTRMLQKVRHEALLQQSEGVVDINPEVAAKDYQILRKFMGKYAVSPDVHYEPEESRGEKSENEK